MAYELSTIVEIKERGLTLSARKGNTISSLLKDSLSGKNASSSPYILNSQRNEL